MTSTKKPFKVVNHEDNYGPVTLAGQQIPVELAAAAPLPNLIVDDYFNLPSRLIPGDTVSVYWKALNTGDATTPASSFDNPAWVDSIYLSTDTQLDPSDVLLGSKPFLGSPAYSGNPLPGSGDPINFYYNYSFAFDHFRIPAEFSGIGYLLLKLDSGNSIAESNEDDNVVASPAISTGPADINLTPTNLEVTTQNLAWGRDYSFNYTLANLGLDDTTTQWLDSLYFSTDTTFDEADRYLSGWTFSRPEGQPMLAAGQSNTFFLELRLPDNEPTQHGYFFLKTNPDADQIEINYTDNVSAPIPVQIEAAEVNLRVSNTANYQQLILDGSKPVSLSFNILNTGTQATADRVKPYDAVFWSTDDKFDFGPGNYDYQLASADNDSTDKYPLAPGASYDTSLSFDLPSWLIGSIGYLLLVSDPYGWLVETNELDNAVAIPTGIYDPNDLPDLSVSFDGDPPEEALLSSQPLQLSWTVTNTAGTGAAPFWYDQLWFSPDGIFDDADPNDDNNDIPGPSFRIDASTVDFWPLYNNWSYTFSPQDLAVPNNISGSGYIYIKTDATGILPEQAESNNITDGLPVIISQPDVNLVAAVYVPLAYDIEQVVDLQIDLVSTLKFFTGRTINFIWGVYNSGSQSTTAPHWFDRVLFSRDDKISTDDITLAERNSGYSYEYPLEGPYSFYSPWSSSYLVFGDPTLQFTIPEDLVGSGYLFLQVDAFDNQYETIETDNIYSRLVEFLAAPHVNLTAQGLEVSLPSNPDDIYTGPVSWGQTINLSWSVAITGDEPTSIFYSDKIVFSSDLIFGNEDDITLINNPSNIYHDPNSSYTVSTQISLPSFAPAITSGYLLFKTDASNYQSEINENDNISIRSITIGAPDLIVSNVTASESGSLGGIVSISWTVENQGTVEASADWTDSVYISSDEVFDGLDTLVTNESITSQTPLAAGGSYSITRNIIPTGQIVPGTRYLLFITDRNNNQRESNENNNLRSVSFRLAAPSIVGLLSAANNQVTGTLSNADTLNPTRSGSYSDDYTLINLTIGEPITLDLSASFDPYLQLINADTQQLISADDNSGPGADSRLTFTPIHGINYTVRATSNSIGATGNYTLSATSRYPELVVLAATAPETGALGGTVSVSWTVQNQGTVEAPGDWTDSVYISSDEIFDSLDILLTNESITSQTPLAVDGSYSINRNITLPGQIAPGNRYLLFITDRNNDQRENNEINNMRTVSFSLTAPPIVGSLSAANNQVTGTLSNTDDLNPTLSGSYSDDYTLVDFTIGEPVTLDLSAPFDAYLQLINADTQQLIASDDDSGPGFDSRLTFTPNVGINYTVRATSFSSRVTGNYTLAATSRFPDLVVLASSAPPSGIVNGAMNVTWTVTNQGNVAALTDWNDYVYLSSDETLGGDNLITSQSISTQTPLAVGSSYTIDRSITIPNVPAGNYYLLFVANGSQNQGETNNNNNLRAVPISVGAPDLVVRNASAPESGSLGGSVSVSWTVQNEGTVEAPADWTDYIYWSSNDTYDIADTLFTSISAAAQTPVAAEGIYTRTQNITIPNKVDFVGNGYLIVRADGNNVQGETNENNNDRAIPIRIDAPDLIVSNATAPESVTLGATISVTWNVENQGVGAANADWYDRVVISTDQIFGNSDDTYLTQVWQGSFTPLAAAATYSRTLNVTLPSTATGDRYLLFKADNYNYQGETDENNNVYSVPINISASDLQVTATNAPSTAILGETVELTWTVTNNGTGAASQDWYDRVYLSNNQTLDGGDVQVTSELIGSQTPLAAGASYTISKNVTLPSFTLGNQYLIFVADRDNYQGEISENNNLAAVPITLTAPDLIVSNGSVPATGTVGKSIEVSWTVQNQGTSAAPTDWYDRIYLSNDAIFDANTDTYITQELISTQTPLAAAASYSTTRNINLPNFATGNRYLIFVADGSGSQGETNESNNTRAAAINLNAPDLIVTDITAPVESLSGQPIEINWTVKNQGTATAEGTWYDYVSLVNTTTNSTHNVGVFEYSGSLAAGASLNRTQSYSVPLGLTGNYRVVVTTDYYGQIAEGTQNESNNTTTDDRPISLQLAPVPNLQVTGVTAPPTAFSSQETVVQWTVKNVGTGATNAPVWYDRIYLSLDTTYDDTDTYLGDVVNPSYLNPNDSYSNSLTVSLPRGIDSNYYFLVQADAHNYVAEVGNEGDNWGSGGPTDVNLTPPPDLQVTAVNAPNGAFSGQPMNLSWTITNAGTGRTLETAWYDRVYMSVDATLDAGDRILGTFYHGGVLNAGANYTGSATVNLPIGVAGSFFLFVQSDIYNNVYEHIFENNNSGYDNTATNITLTPPPDLEFESLTIPNNARSGSSLSISYRVTNFGATETPNYYWTDTFYLSSDNQLNTATDINLGSVGQYGVLYPGDGYDRTANFSLPNTLTGTYYVFGVTDSGDQVFELNNVNNFTQSINQVQIVSQPADLVVTDAVIPTTGEAGKAISVQWTVKNQGTGDTIVNSWSDRLVASTNGVLGDADDLTLASFIRTGLLGFNGTYSRSESVILPFALEGNYQLFVVTDSDDSVYEGSHEGNNASSPVPLTISRDTPDLQVRSITLPNTVTPGQPLTLNWTVANLGVGRTNRNYWYDRVYLSLDQNVSNDDIDLGSVYRSGALDPSASYSATGTFSLPVNLNGSYYVLVQTDRDNNVIEGTFENNNFLASDSTSGGASGTGSLPITPASSADLAVTAVDAPEQGIAGQSLSLTWTVVNNDANTGQSWYDAVYLSRDQVFDRRSDIYMGYRNHTGGLNAGESYTAIQSFNIPRGLGGRFYAFVVTDGGNAVYERLGEINNVNYDGFSTGITIPQSSDLVVTYIATPSSGIPGQNISINYTVHNQGTDTAYGSWKDSIYLSQDTQWDVNDALVGQVNHSGDIASDASYTGVFNGVIPGVNLGNYYVIVRSDILNQVSEVNEGNNVGDSSSKITLDVEELSLETPDTGNLGQGHSVYYRFDAQAGQAIRLSFDSSNNQSFNELYVSYGKMPSRGQFDLTTTQPFSADPEIVIPIDKTGIYYVLAYGDQVSGSPSYQILAQDIPFSITKVNTDTIGNFGEATLEIYGAKFIEGTNFQLLASNGSVIEAEQVYLENSTLAYVTFDLFDDPIGLYDLKANHSDGSSVILADSITVQTATGYDLNSNITGPEEVRPGRDYFFNVNYGNEGDTDAIAPLLIIESVTNTQVGTTLKGLTSDAPLHLLGVSNDGPQGILRPGDLNVLPVYFNSNTDPIEFQVRSYDAKDETVINWNSLEASVRPDGLTEAQWNSFFGEITARVKTYGGYVKLINDMSEELSGDGDLLYDVRDLFARMYEKNPVYVGQNQTLSGQLLNAETGLPVVGAQMGLYHKQTTQLGATTTTDVNGNFTFTGLEGNNNYQLVLQGEYFDNDRDGEVDLLQSPHYIVPLGQDVSGVQVYTYQAPTPTTQDIAPSFVVDSTGVSHVIWERNGEIWHSYLNGSEWVDAAAITGVSGNKFQIQAAPNLIDNKEPGLLVTWQNLGSEINRSEIYYAVGRAKTEGGYQWSDPVALTNNAIADDNPSVIITDSGDPIVVYQRSDDSLDDDTDLYYDIVDIQSNEVIWSTDISIDSLIGLLREEGYDITSEEAQDLQMLATQTVGFSISFQATLPTLSKIGFPDEVKAQLKTEGSFNIDCVAKLAGKGSLQLELTGSKAPVGVKVAGEFAYGETWKTNKKQCVYVFDRATGSGGASLTLDFKQSLAELAIKLLPPGASIAGAVVIAVLEKKFGLQSDFGISVKGGLVGNVIWDKAPPLEQILPDSGSYTATIAVGPYGKIKRGNDEVRVYGNIGTKADVWPKFDVKEIFGELGIDIKFGWRKYTYKYLPSTEVTIFGDEFGSVFLPSSIDPSEFVFEVTYDPTGITGTTNVYGDNHVFSDVNTNTFDDSEVSLVKVGDSKIFMIWTQDNNPALGQEGSSVYTALFDGTQWNNPVQIPDSKAYNGDPVLAFNNNGQLLAIWSMADSSGINENSTPEQALEAESASDIVYSIYSDGNWSSPFTDLSRAGSDDRLAITKAADGRLILSWVNQDSNGLDSLLVSLWDGNSWSTAQSLNLGRIVDRPALSLLNNQEALFWTEDIDPSPNITTAQIYYRVFNGTWSQKILFNPTVAIAPSEAVSSVPITPSLFPVGSFSPPEKCCECKPGDKDCDDPPYKPPVRRSSDPNDILGPEGFGEDRWIDTDEPLRYTIRFENVATATAPAQTVFITQQLDADLDWRTFRVDDYGWSGAIYELAGNRAFHSSRIDLTETKGFYVDIAATIDTLTGIATWRISTVDPSTGEAPLDAQQGFLPTNDENGRGEGFVTYSIRPKSTAKTGDVVDAEAEIIFDTEEPIKTPSIFNTLDTDKPTSQINSLPESTDNPQFLVSWAGSDSGSAIASYTIYVSDNDGDYTPWLTNSTLTESTYQGQPGHSYQFYALATDNVGNIQEVPTTAQATIRVTGGDIPPAGVNLNEGGGNTLVAEDGSTDSYTFTLQSQPTAEVRISFSTTGGQLTLSRSELIFTPDNWNSSQSVVISAVDDDLTEGPHTATIQHSISSTDASYAGLTIPALSVQVQDNDASITGKIWNDADGNHLNNGEAGLAGWTVFLDADLDGELDPDERTSLTNDTGSYRFDDLRPGVVSVAQVLQSGWRQTFPRLAMSTTASDLPLVLPSVDLGLPPTGLSSFNFSHSNYVVKEDGTALSEVWISRGGDLSRSASVTLHLSDGTATGCVVARAASNSAPEAESLSMIVTVAVP
jgi:subtilase family serine protease